jgi:hypothetical protein
MPESMFDVETLKGIRRKADELSYQCMNRKLANDPQALKMALDNICRALGTFAEVEIHRIKNENIAYDPQSYIRGRLAFASKAMKTVPQEDSNTA